MTEPKKRGRPSKTNRSNRTRRSPVGGKRDVLTAKGDLDFEKYHYHIVNEKNIQEFQSYGYEIDESDNVSMTGDHAPLTGSANTAIADRRDGMKAVLMRQPIEIYEEDRKLRAETIDKSEESMLRDLKESEGRYGDVKTR